MDDPMPAAAMPEFGNEPVIGLTVKQVDALLEPYDCFVRVVSDERGDFAITAEFNPNRCNVTTKNNIITEVGDWG